MPHSLQQADSGDGNSSAQTELHESPLAPTNPYGETKLALENALRWYGQAYGLQHTCLRYFNAAGASARNGESHDPETHLIPIVLEVALGRRPVVSVFGDRYPTADGTCVRDYVHVSDLARAHVVALRAMQREGGPPRTVYNLGCGGGYSVKQVIAAARAVTGRAIGTEIVAPRSGDPAVLVASSDLIRQELGWRPERQSLEVILADAWAWLEAHPRGYGD